MRFLLLAILFIPLIPMARLKSETYVSEEESNELNTILQKAKSVFEQQLQQRFVQGDALRIESEMQSKSKQGNSRQTESHICVFSNLGGLDFSRTLYAGKKEAQFLIKLENQEYGAYLSSFSGTASRDNLLSLEELASPKYRLDTLWRNSESKDWFQSAIRDAATARFFNFGNVLFSDGLDQWRDNQGTVKMLPPVEGSNSCELQFEGWPAGEAGKMSYFVDTQSFAITQIRGKFDTVSSTLKILAFDTENLVPMPAQLELRNDSPEQSLCKTTHWKRTPIESLGFVEDSLYLNYYGLGRPDLDSLPPEGRYQYSLGIVGAVLLGIGCYVVRKKLVA